MEPMEDSRDVAYLRLSVHVQEKHELGRLRIKVPPIFDEQFQNVYDEVSILVPDVDPAISDDKSRLDTGLPVLSAPQIELGAPSIVDIGNGTFVTNTIMPPST